MTEYELEELLTITTMAGVEVFAMYVTILGSYLVAAYLAGKRLSFTQSLTVSVLFVYAASLTTYVSYAYLARAIPMADALQVIHPDRLYGAQPITQGATLLLQAVGILTCLKFMWDIRHPKTE